MPARLVAAVVLALLCSAAAAVPAAARTSSPLRTYVVDGVRTALDRAAVAGTGAAIVQADHGSVVVSASRSDVRELSRVRYPVTRSLTRRQGPAAPGNSAADFPPADRGYHTYAELSAETLAIAQANPSIVGRFSLGRSYEGRDVWALKVCDTVTSDETEPEVFCT